MVVAAVASPANAGTHVRRSGAQARLDQSARDEDIVAQRDRCRAATNRRSLGAVNLHALRITYGDVAGFVGVSGSNRVLAAQAGWTVRDLVHHLLGDAQRALDTTRDWLVGGG